MHCEITLGEAKEEETTAIATTSRLYTFVLLDLILAKSSRLSLTTGVWEKKSFSIREKEFLPHIAGPCGKF